MKTLQRTVLILACVILVAIFAAAQNLSIEERGLKPFGAYEGGNLDSVSMSNGSLILHIPFWSYSQRGGRLRLNYFISFTSNNWGLAENCAGPNGCVDHWQFHGNCETDAEACAYGGIKTKTDQGLSVISKNVKPDPNHLYTIYSAVLASGQVVQLGLLPDGSYRSFDGSGIYFQSATPYERDGTRTQGTQVYDTNGNYITHGGASSFTDTLGRSIPGEVATTNQNDLSQCDNSPVTLDSATVWNLPAPTDPDTQTSTAKIIFCKVRVHVHRDSYDNGTNVGPPFDQDPLFIQNIVMPNGTKWKFEYQVNEGNVTKITLPTGGSISYVWIPWVGAMGCSPGDTSGAISSRTVDAADGNPTHTWQYHWQTSANVNKATDPLGNDTVYTMGAGGCSRYPTQVQTYQGSSASGTLLKTVQTQYLTVTNLFDPDKNPAVLLPTTVTTILPNGSSTVQSKTLKDYAGPGNVGQFTYCEYTTGCTGATAYYGNVFNFKEYDAGTGAPGSLLRETVNSYKFTSDNNYKNNNLLDLLSSVRINDGSGNQMAYTTYAYDETTYPVQSSGISTQHTTPPNSYRGNVTSVNRWLNTTSSYLSSHNYFYDTGTVQRAIDPVGTAHTTTYTYSATFAGAYPTQVQLPDTGSPAVHHITKANYDFNSGVTLQTTDENGNNTNYRYDLLGRSREIDYPDAGQVTYAYTDSVPSPSVVLSEKLTPSLNSNKEFIFDGLGRLAQTQHTSDPDGTTKVDIDYDALGQKASESNPYRNSGPIYLTQYQYDALGRITKMIPTDGSASAYNVATVYTGNQTTVTDEAGKTRKSQVDGLNRLTKVWEDPSGLNYETDYVYDALGNMLCAAQKGTNTGTFTSCAATPASWRKRSFVYDSLSRLTSSTNPETGTISYTYNLDSNISTKTAPRPNQTGSTTTTTTYTYDADHRLTGKVFDDGTQNSVYTYDVSSVWGITVANPIGNRVLVSAAAGAYGTVYSYDTMGRPVSAWNVISGPATQRFDYAYNYDGSPKTITYPSGRIVTYTVNGAGRLTDAKDVANSVNYVTSATYSPHGALATMTKGLVSGGFAGIATSNTFDKRLQPSVQSASANGQPVLSLTYDYHLNSGDNGNVYGVTNGRDGAGRPRGTMAYTFDSLNRIVTAATPDADCTVIVNGLTNNWATSFGYDAWGNLLNITVTKCTAVPMSASVNNNNQVNNWCYDTAGNLLAPSACPSQIYTYDGENRLTNTAGYTYIYDGDGQRVKKVAGSTGTIYYRGAGTEPLLETDLSGNPQEEYIFFNGERVARRTVSTGAVHYYHSDHLGSTSVVTTASGAVEEEEDFYPFGGMRLINSQSLQNYHFTGKERDSESGLDNFGARYYVSPWGRFLTPDWAAKATAVPYAHFGNPQSLNLYSYVVNNPVTTGDPDGHAPPGPYRSASGMGDNDTNVDIFNQDVEQHPANQAAAEQEKKPEKKDGSAQNTSQNQSQTQTQQSQPPSPGQKVLTQVEKEFPDLNVTNVKDLKAHNGHENISVTGSATNDQMAQIKKTLADNAGLFGPGSRINIEIGNGTYSLHVEFAQFNSSGDTGTVSFQSHIDRGNPNAGPVGLLKHVFVDGLVGAVFHHNDPGLDPQ